MFSLTSASRNVSLASRYQSRSSMYIRGLIQQNWPGQFRLVVHCLSRRNKKRLLSNLSQGSVVDSLLLPLCLILVLLFSTLYPSSFAIIMVGNGELVALLKYSSCYLVTLSVL